MIYWYEQIENREERKKEYALGLERINEYLETGDMSSGMMVSYDDFK